MTFRERIADWISGGALTFAKNSWKRNGVIIFDLQAKCDDFGQRLDRIAACETPNANATVRRMAAIARGEK